MGLNPQGLMVHDDRGRKDLDTVVIDHITFLYLVPRISRHFPFDHAVV